MAQAMLQRLRELGDEYNLRDPRKLLQIAQRQGIAATSKLATEALAGDVGRQVLRPPPRATGKAAATRPDSTLQADLIDFSNNLPPTSKGNRYAVVLSDVFTRELRTAAVPSKDPETVAAVLKPMITNLTDGDQNYTLSTDKGAEFTRLDLPVEAAHRLKAGKQDLAVIDRGIQTIKKGLASKTAKNNKEWDDNIEGVQRAYNATPHSTTIVAPEDVELEPSALFRGFQREADNFIVNRAQSERRMGEVKETKTIRAPLQTQGRSFRPQYGDALKVKKVDSLHVETTTGRRVLTKEAQAVPADSTRRAAGQLTDPAYVKRQRLQAEANQVEQHVLGQPENRMRITDLERSYRTSMPTVARGLQRARTRLRPFLQMFPRMFKVERGILVAANAPAPPPEPPPPPRIETREERNARLDALLAASREREERARATRAETQRARLAALRGVYGERAR